MIAAVLASGPCCRLILAPVVREYVPWNSSKAQPRTQAKDKPGARFIKFSLKDVEMCPSTQDDDDAGDEVVLWSLIDWTKDQGRDRRREMPSGGVGWWWAYWILVHDALSHANPGVGVFPFWGCPRCLMSFPFRGLSLSFRVYVCFYFSHLLFSRMEKSSGELLARSETLGTSGCPETDKGRRRPMTVSKSCQLDGGFGTDFLFKSFFWESNQRWRIYWEFWDNFSIVPKITD